MIPHVFRKKHPYAFRMANRDVNNVVARAKGTAGRRARKGYGFDINTFIKREIWVKLT